MLHFIFAAQLNIINIKSCYSNHTLCFGAALPEQPSYFLFEQQQLLKLVCLTTLAVISNPFWCHFLLSCLIFRKKGGRPNRRLFSYVECDSYVNLDEVGSNKLKRPFTFSRAVTKGQRLGISPSYYEYNPNRTKRTS